MDTLSLMIEYPFFYEINLTIMLGNSVYYNIIEKMQAFFNKILYEIIYTFCRNNFIIIRCHILNVNRYKASLV